MIFCFMSNTRSQWAPERGVRASRPYKRQRSPNPRSERHRRPALSPRRQRCLSGLRRLEVAGAAARVADGERRRDATYPIPSSSHTGRLGMEPKLAIAHDRERDAERHRPLSFGVPTRACRAVSARFVLSRRSAALRWSPRRARPTSSGRDVGVPPPARWQRGRARRSAARGGEGRSSRPPST